MPELPEVETLVRDLRPALTGARIATVELLTPSMLREPAPEHLEARLTGRTVTGVSRRGKYVHVSLDSGDHLVIHLGMTGQILMVAAALPPRPHVHLRLALADGRQLLVRDPRRFGRLALGGPDELLASGVIPALGPEPLEENFNADLLAARLRGRRAPIKALLLNQAVVAGIGNIYADEALFRAGIRPTRAGGALSAARVRRLVAALKEVLQEGISNRGTTVSDYRDLNGGHGGQQRLLRVYGRSGEPCLSCGRPLRSRRIAGRTSVYCSRCQR